MGWGNCGEDSKGRPIGYCHEGKCDHEGCEEEIDRGISYACGDMHGDDEVSCEKYFCETHKNNHVKLITGQEVNVCEPCAQALIDSGEWHEDEEEGLIVRYE